MNIGIDARLLFNQEGVGQYIKYLIKSLSLNTNYKTYVFLNKFDKDKIISKNCGQKINLSYNQKYYNNFYIPIEIKKEKINIWHTPQNVWIPKGKNYKKILTIHDIIPYILENEVPNINKEKYLKLIQENLNNADKIFVDSYCTKNDILKYLKINDKKISVLYPPISLLYKNIENEKINEIRKKYNLNQKYIINTGRTTYRKNIERLIQGFLASNFKGDLVITGNINNMLDDIKKKYQNPRIKFTGFILLDDLFILYSKAEMLLYPSLYEGYGYPIVEAFALKCPVITSNSSSLKEIAEDAGLLVDPYNTDDIKEKINLLDSNNELKQILISKGIKQAEKFNFETFSKNLYKEYESLI